MIVDYKADMKKAKKSKMKIVFCRNTKKAREIAGSDNIYVIVPEHEISPKRLKEIKEILS